MKRKTGEKIRQAASEGKGGNMVLQTLSRERIKGTHANDLVSVRWHQRLTYNDNEMR